MIRKTKRTDNPFRIKTADGTVFTFKHPLTVKLTDLKAVDHTKPLQALSLILGTEQCAALSKHPDVDGYFVEAALERYMEHYAFGPNRKGGA